MDDCIIAYGMNGEAVRPQNGFPLRLMVPGFDQPLLEDLGRADLVPPQLRVRVQVPPYVDHLLAYRLDPREYVRDQQLMTHPAIVHQSRAKPHADDHTL